MKDRKSIKYSKIVLIDYYENFQWFCEKSKLNTGFQLVGIDEVKHPNINLLWYP